MLKQIRNFSNGIGTKILLAFIILSFAIWGVGDMVRQSGHNPTLVSVGNTTISKTEFAQKLHQETENLKQSLGNNFSPELLKRVNLEAHVLQRLVNQQLLQQESEALGIIPADADVARTIRTSPTYRSPQGNFDKAHFELMLRSLGLSEKAYIEQLRHDMASTFVIDSITSAPSIPEHAATTLLSSHLQQRTIALYTLTPALVGTPPQPKTEEMDEFYKAHITEFTAPELRTASYVSLTQADAKKPTSIAAEDLQKAYQERIDEFKKPEQRTVDQLIYGNEESAKKAYAAINSAIKSGKTFAQAIAADLSRKDSNILNNTSISLGTVDRSGVLASAADQIFSLKKGEITEPVKSNFGWHIFTVEAIIPPATQSLEEVRPSLEKELLQHTSDKALSMLANKLEDAIAAGSTLKEASDELGLKTITLPAFDKNGKLENGTPAKNIPPYDKFIETTFKTDEKSESGLVTIKGGNYYIVRVESITPEHARPLAEVKDMVTSGWQKEWQQKKLAALAKEISSSFASDTARATAITTYKLAAPAALTVKRSDDNSKPLPAGLLADIFALPVNAATNATALANGDYAIAVVKAIIPATISDKDPKLAEIRKQFKENVQAELTDQYLRYLTQKYTVSINESAFTTKSQEQSQE